MKEENGKIDKIKLDASLSLWSVITLIATFVILLLGLNFAHLLLKVMITGIPEVLLSESLIIVQMNLTDLETANSMVRLLMNLLE